MIVVPKVITATDIVDGWTQATNILLNDAGGKRKGLTIHINEPSMPEPISLRAHDAARIDHSIKSVADVANTIFPRKGRLWARNISDFTNWYNKAYRRRKTGTWGTYFQRMVDFGPNHVNQIEQVLKGLNDWGGRHSAAFVIHLSSAELDKPRKIGGPCLQYLQVGDVGGNQMGMTAVYRSHDYYQKALGNFLGLSRLLHYLCEKTGKDVGSITCLSSYAFLSGSKTNTRKLIGF